MNLHLVPSRAPTNLRVVNRTSSTSLLLLWDAVPQEHVNGILTGYTIRFKAVEQGPGIKISDHFRTMEIAAEVDRTEILNLEPYTRYTFSIYAKTRVGNGIYSEPVVGGRSIINREFNALRNVSY